MEGGQGQSGSRLLPALVQVSAILWQAALNNAVDIQLILLVTGSVFMLVTFPQDWSLRGILVSTRAILSIYTLLIAMGVAGIFVDNPTFKIASSGFMMFISVGHFATIRGSRPSWRWIIALLGFLVGPVAGALQIIDSPTRQAITDALIKAPTPVP